MTHSAAICDLLRRARRRALAQVLAGHLAWGVTAALALSCGLLLAGVQLFAWPWLLLLALLAAVVTGWRLRASVPTPYQVAQLLDARLGLADLLSTAWHFSTRAMPEGEFKRLLEARADAAARRLDPCSALPWRWTRGATAATLALLVTGALVTLRYGEPRTFKPGVPFARVSFDTLTGAPRLPAPAARPLPARWPFFEGATVEDPDGARISEQERAMQESLRSVEVPAASQVARQGTGQDGQSGESADENGRPGETASPGQNPSPGAANEARQNAQAPPPRTPPEKKNSLLDKMRDALANLMEKLKTTPQDGQNQRTASNKQGASGRPNGERGSRQPNQPSQSGQSQRGQLGDGASESARQQAHSNQPGSNPEHTPNSDKSGVGRSDGRKEIELAEQQKALGKLSELLGKRALDVRGEVLAEVTNSRAQQLKTAYVDRSATHVEAGSELNRDEVPPQLREYVRGYYERVRPAAPRP